MLKGGTRCPQEVHPQEGDFQSSSWPPSRQAAPALLFPLPSTLTHLWMGPHWGAVGLSCPFWFALLDVKASSAIPGPCTETVLEQ